MAYCIAPHFPAQNKSTIAWAAGLNAWEAELNNAWAAELIIAWEIDSVYTYKSESKYYKSSVLS